MDPHAVSSLPGALSTPRLSTYLGRYHGDTRLALRLYAWNSELAGAFMGPLSMVEVVTRNAIHNQLRAGGQDDWWNTQRYPLAPREGKSLTSAIDKLFWAGNTNPSADDVVAATTFGFWVGLLDVGVARHPRYDYETRIWRPAVAAAFPHRRGRGRRQVHAQLNRIRKFRNRVMHHEPIFNGYQTMKALIVESIGWVDPDVATFVEQSHQIDLVANRMQDAVTNGNCRI